MERCSDYYDIELELDSIDREEVMQERLTFDMLETYKDESKAGAVAMLQMRMRK